MTKSELFDQNLQEVSTFFKVMGHPARLSILKYLSESKTCMTGDISNELPLSRTTVYQHLKELKDLGLIIGEIEGVKVNYCLNKERIGYMKRLLEEYLQNIEMDYDLLC